MTHHHLLTIPHAGSLFYDIVGGAASGTGTARTAINATYTVPQEAREWAAALPWQTAEAPIAAESQFAVFDVIGTGFKDLPQEFWGPIGQSGLGAINAIATTAVPLWEIHLKVSGGETPWNIGIEPLDALSGNGRAGITMAFSTMASGLPYIRSLSARETGTGTTAATITALSTLSPTNPVSMVEIGGAATGSTVAANEQIEGEFSVTCQAWKGIQTINFEAEPAPAVQATSGQQYSPSFARLPFDPAFTARGTVNITGTFTLRLALTTAGQFAHYVRYI